ncbi:hypothetical protein EVB81_148 [Rhizobium phage RHph_I46]|uniref:Uncharacterized protein n=1 Tax=Rhizobium phage RHph_I1_9 TaxID=2509729 RepID=A0A7S5UY65_9CAUD|nr:hypothetical protein PP936_gp147 [Rhizobium phage RHph_I1_9]QIG69717.1 hypothetical protein EVB81_148 [Rhizobium phage RHph_I46]QIG70998.1 hypothetical protein EVB92_148 [Rhizobium phage RHph_I9]QIG73584.1 hypothetical protein EVC04_147 [Rhizobium phage RHph_I1_9]QIG76337.1 hypothetical protein EVC25_148 [Rhizobium phage RHph_I34]
MNTKIWIAFTDFLLACLTVSIVLLGLVLQKYVELKTTVQGNTIDKSEFLIEMTWEEGSPNDVDILVQDPRGALVFYQTREIGMMTLDRDDRGSDNNTVFLDNGQSVTNNIRREVVSIRGIIPGKYVVNGRMFANNSGQPSNVKITVRKLNPYVEISEKTYTLLSRTDEKTYVSFELDKQGNVISTDQITQYPLSQKAKLN